MKPLNAFAAVLITLAASPAKPQDNSTLPNPPSWDADLKKLGTKPKTLDGVPKRIPAKFKGERHCTADNPPLIDQIVVFEPPVVVTPPQQLTYLHLLAVEEEIIRYCDRDAPPEPNEQIVEDDEKTLKIKAARRRILAAAGHRV